MQLSIADKKSKLDVSEATFGQAYNEPLVHQVVTAYLAGARAGTATQKTRSEVSGGGKKPWKQKGTGRARAGSTRGPIWRGGGVTFASKQRSYKQKVNRKMYRSALRSIVSELARQDRLLVLDKLSIAEPKTKLLKAELDKLKLEGALFLVDQIDNNLMLASRNLPHVAVILLKSVTPVLLLQSKKVVITVAAVKQLEEWLA